MKAFVFIIFILLCTSTAWSQPSLDSLKRDRLRQTYGDTNEVKILIALSKAVRRSDKTSAEAYADTAITVAEKLQDKWFLGDAYLNRGTIDQKNELSIPFLEKSLAMYVSLRNEDRQARVHASLAFLFSNLGLRTKAMDHYLKSYTIKERLGDRYTAAALLNSIAIEYTSIDNHSKALEYLEKAFALLKNSDPVMVHTLGNLATAYLELEQYDKALHFYKMALEVCEKYDRPRFVPSFLGNIAVTYMKIPEAKLATLGISPEQRADSMLLYVNRSFQISKKDKREHEDAVTHMTAARGYLLKKDSKTAWSHISRAQALTDSMKQSMLREPIAFLKSDYYELTGQFDSAIIYHKTGVKLKDEYAKSLQVSEIEKIGFEFTYNRKEDSLVIYKKVIDEQIQQQALLAFKHQQTLQLRQASLTLLTREKELQNASFINTTTELHAEKALRSEKEKQLAIAKQGSLLEANKEKIRKARLQLTENALHMQTEQQLFLLGFFIALIILSVVIFRGIKHRQKANTLIANEKIKTQRAENLRQMAEFEMHSLRAQLNPHFMFNSLNAIQAQILKEQNESASLYLMRFAKMLRMLLDNAEHSFITLSTETHFLQLYLYMEKLRIPDLDFELRTPSGADLETIFIPNMILQPYIENAIWHGLAEKPGLKKIIINFEVTGENLTIVIEDNGVGRKKSAELKSIFRSSHKSKGMELLQKRFDLIEAEYGSQIQIQVIDLEEKFAASGTRVEITLPVKYSSQQAIRQNQTLEMSIA